MYKIAIIFHPGFFTLNKEDSLLSPLLFHVYILIKISSQLSQDNLHLM